MNNNILSKNVKHIKMVPKSQQTDNKYSWRDMGNMYSNAVWPGGPILQQGECICYL